MRNPKYLLDTTVLIDHLNRHPQATDWLLSLQDGEAVISAVTRAEVLTGCDSEQERRETADFLDCYDCLPVTAQTADLAADVRKKYRLKLPDALQAALAKQHSLKLCTHNTKDFLKISGLVHVPYA